MKVKNLQVNVVTLGCAKNIVDSEVLMAQLRANDFSVSHEAKRLKHDIVIINTCGFIEAAKQESINTILHYVDLKQAGKIKKVYVTGCLSERYKNELQQEIPEVDAYFGTTELASLLATLNADYKKELLGERMLTTPKHYAYLKISEGCDRPCSFCAIPLMRGKHVSKPMEKILQEAQFLVENGVKEIMLIAQDLTYYGLDLYHTRKLNDLLIQLAQIKGLAWIRLHYTYPAQFPEEILDTMREHSNICKYIDIPLQHISDNMLKIMRRGITKRKTIELIEKIRAKVPNIAIRTTLIAGHPGETENDFEELKSFIEETQFERLGIFTYSHEENTHAYTLGDTVPDVEKRRRADEIMEIQQDIAFELNHKKIGQTLPVLIDRKEGQFWVGRTEHDSPEVDNEVLIKTDIPLKIGSFVSVNITECTEFDLYGTANSE
ncbi:MAG: 30S ribosomal protein S12 methylthiotransferase RimO [Bacteroidia bacterium]|nr:30S ribosomal protein S12 methylthiotransferase RimO [Bacteroidia bacterium]MDW8345874.1 30S ribosomal protein S12 methylthiotransferase RimO [Bacteroidia bacterium]